jgi:hypothetical protein
MDDTHPQVRAEHTRLYREMSPARRVEIALQLSRMVDDAAMAGVLERHPGCSEREAGLRLAVLKYGPELVERAYGWRAPEGEA